jgi:hypothetical protein
LRDDCVAAALAERITGSGTGLCGAIKLDSKASPAFVER